MLNTPCPACGGTSLEELDDNLVCTDCDHIIEQIEEHIEYQSLNFSQLTSLPTASQKQMDSKTDGGIEWSMPEAFSFLVSRQADYLLKKGACSHTKKVLFNCLRLYVVANELQPLNSANPKFLRRRDLLPCLRKLDYNLMQKVFRKEVTISSEDIEVLQEEEVDTFLIASLDNSAPKETTRERDEVTCNEIKIEQTILSRSEEITDANQMSDSEKQALHLSNIIPNREHRLHWLRNFPRFHRHIQNGLTHGRTVSLCYLALLYTKSRILLSDLIYWIYRTEFPYKDVNAMPNEMKLIHFDNSSLKSKHLPSSLRVRRNVFSIIKSTPSLPPIPPQDPYFVLREFARKLYLPNDILNLILRLFSSSPPQVEIEVGVSLSHVLLNPHDFAISNFEGYIMAYIVVAFKILFGLNGDSEGRSSFIASRLNCLLPFLPASKFSYFFVYDEWILCLFKSLRMTHPHHFDTIEENLNKLMLTKSCRKVRNRMKIQSTNFTSDFVNCFAVSRHLSKSSNTKLQTSDYNHHSTTDVANSSHTPLPESSKNEDSKPDFERFYSASLSFLSLDNEFSDLHKTLYNSYEREKQNIPVSESLYLEEAWQEYIKVDGSLKLLPTKYSCYEKFKACHYSPLYVHTSFANVLQICAIVAEMSLRELLHEVRHLEDNIVKVL